MTLTSKQIKECLTQPEAAAHLADLVYIQDQHLSIHRKKHGKGFTYLIDNKERLSDAKQLKRIKSLVIPPAWQEVRISKIPNGHLQVVGRDDKGRKVYLYHNIWTLLRNQTKFFKMSAFAKALPKIRKRLQKDLDLKGMPREKCLALVLSIMDLTYIRVGNQYYADKNKTYGLSTLRTKHVDEENGKILFSFTGKKGVQQNTTIENPELIEFIHQCEEIPGWELFKYYDTNGKHHAIDSGMINDYMHEIAGEIFSAKDFRTWGATREFFEKIIELPQPKSEKECDKNILKGYDAAAAALGNTRAVCKQYYVHPQISNIYGTDQFADYRDKIRSYKDDALFSASEKCIQEIIDEFEITFSLTKE
ncbi:DNA topoisomerase-1 [Nonlabens xylanidelens]|uniref:DNA topoisomerase n=1 Tax=Nonlabens xylanidelens TaxID=191564 RepID=A0A2S6ILV9_9FLAO|nr:DNA topoisomerase IB [Nonlabens xylanidelens]PPK95130.1 DNA topoisomerase-1 [Nonlabens xylanidelens]PQJ17659.1 DNA topoisomerase I [Nonlabens xylanidelens]